MIELNHNGEYLGIIRKNFLLFWHGVFSQWYKAEFKIDKIKYNCAEQYMMSKKAILFNDLKTNKQIMLASHPGDQKRLGRKVKGFDAQTWNKHAIQIVYDGNYGKFTQNTKLFECLKLTDKLIIVEASPKDTIWGIGLDETHPNADEPSKWRGKNWLGNVLTKLRDDLTH